VELGNFQFRCLILTSLRDEVLYHAKLHPEQYSDTFSTTQLKQLHTSIMHVCQTAVDALGDSSKFPDEWLFNHRWGKGKKDAPTTLPNGEKITFLKVGGRTSCVVPGVQKKTGAVAGDLKTGDMTEEKTNGKTSKKRKTPDENEDDKLESKASKKVDGRGRGKKSDVAVKDEKEEEEVPNGKAKKRRAVPEPAVNTTESVEMDSKTASGRRRSGRGIQKPNYEE
jgi:formamidopyrimidine-DNA glycosylase